MCESLGNSIRKLVGFTLPVTLLLCLAVGGPARADQVILDDLIVDGSNCVGMDCVNGESFGFDTLRLKENNLRIKAMDTSSTASFPSNDWQITFNDSSNGGANKFSIDDIDGGRTPFTIEAGAPSHSLYVDDGGRIGFGTSTPVVDLHVKSGNTPTLRLEQDGSSGFTPQTWDVAGNEANFFVRDATNGSTLPFRVFPGAPSSALTIEGTTGDVGIGTTSPAGALHVSRSADVFPLFESTSSGQVAVVLRSDSDDRRIIGGTSTGTTNQSQIRLKDSGEILFSGETDGLRSAGGDRQMTLDGDGNLTVETSIAVGTQTLNVPDYVFEPDYELMPIDELDRFVRQKKHLPRVPSAQEVKNTGSVNVTQMQMRLLEKVEELTLYTIEQQKTIDELKQRLGRLETQGNN